MPVDTKSAAITHGDGAKPIQFGLIAEDVAEVFPELALLLTARPNGGR